MRYARLTLASPIIGLTLSACIPGGVLTDRDKIAAKDVAPLYIPTTRYDGWSCAQLTAEIQKTDQQIAEIGSKLEAGEYDKSGSLVVTPLFLMYDNTRVMDKTPEKAQELARLKGDAVSLKEAAAKAHCA